MKYLVTLLFLLPCALNADIYRCESRGDTYFSQIPCDDLAEEVVITDQHMFSDPTEPVSPVPAGVEAGKGQVRSSADNLQEFVETLHRQRNEQMAAVDGDIRDVEGQLASEQLPADDPQREALNKKLASLQSSRDSIGTQYESMIAEAERRLAEMATGPTVADQSGAGES